MLAKLKHSMLYQNESGYKRTVSGQLPLFIDDVNKAQDIDNYRVSGQLVQKAVTYNEYTYTCDGTETGRFYFVVDGVNYKFTMPYERVAGSKIIFDEYDKKLWFNGIGEKEISVMTGEITGLTHIDMSSVQKQSPNEIHPEDITGVGLETDSSCDFKTVILKNYMTYEYDYNSNFRHPETIYDKAKRKVTINIPTVVVNSGLSITLKNQLTDFNVGDTIRLTFKVYEFLTYQSDAQNLLTVRIYNETKGAYVFIKFINASSVNKEMVFTQELNSSNYAPGDEFTILLWTEDAIKFTVGNFIVTKPSLEKEVVLHLGDKTLYAINSVYDEYDAKSGTVTKRLNSSNVSVIDAVPNSKYFSTIKSNCYATASGVIPVTKGEKIVYQMNNPTIQVSDCVNIPLYAGNNVLYSSENINAQLDMQYRGSKKES